MTRVILQVPLLGVLPSLPSPALSPQRFLQPPVLVHLGLEVVLPHLGQNVGEEGGEEAGVDLCVLRVESVEMLAEGGHHLRVDREWLSLSLGHQRNQSHHVLVSHQGGEDLGQLSLKVGVELGFDVEAVHIGKYGDDTTQGMKVLNQSLGNQFE